jgi:carbonic anhydrase
LNENFEDIDQFFVEGNKQYQWKILQEEEFNQIDNKIPRYPILILTCMDPRIDVYRIFQLKPGDVFVLRNAGNIYTEDILRSVLVAIHKYKIQYIAVLGHLDCGMKKLHVGTLIDKLNDSAIKRFMWSETNFYLGFQKFFKAFTDEIMNIKSQVQKFRKAREIPSDIKITGMLYDPNTGWVFTDEELRRYSNYENFAKSYHKILQTKKLELVEYIKDNAEEIIGDAALKEVEELIDISEHEENSPLVEDTKYQESINISKLEDIPNEIPILNANKIVSVRSHNNLISIPKIKIPKIFIPKIQVHVPVRYKKSKEGL